MTDAEKTVSETFDELLKAPDLARMFGVNVSTISRWAKRGKIPSYRTPTGRVRFRRSEIEKIMRGER